MKITGYARVRVTLTDVGVAILNELDVRIIKRYPSTQYADELRDRIRTRKAGDAYEANIWKLMSDFGPHIGVGCMLPFCAGELEIIDAETHRCDLKRRMYRVR